MKNKLLSLLCVAIVASSVFGIIVYVNSHVLDAQEKKHPNIDMSGIQVSCAYLGEDQWYKQNGFDVDPGCKPITYMIFIDNHSKYDLDNIMMQTITQYPNTVPNTNELFGEGPYDILSGWSGNSSRVTLQVSQDLTDEEIYESLSANKLNIQFQIDKDKYTLPVTWCKGTKQEIQDYVMPDDELE